MTPSQFWIPVHLHSHRDPPRPEGELSYLYLGRAHDVRLVAPNRAGGGAVLSFGRDRSWDCYVLETPEDVVRRLAVFDSPPTRLGVRHELSDLLEWACREGFADHPLAVELRRRVST